MKKAYAKHITGLLLFGTNGVVARNIAMQSESIIFYRTLIGSLFLIALFLLRKQKPQFLKNKRHFAYIAASGGAMGISWLLLFEAYTYVGVSMATLLYYCGPVFLMALAPLVFKEKMTKYKALGFATVLLGMGLINGRTLLQGGVSQGMLLGLLSAIMYALMMICNKKADSIQGVENAMCQLVASFLTVAVYTLCKQGGLPAIPAQSLPPLLLLGLVNTGVGCFLYFSSVQQLRAQSAAICGYLEPLSALLFSALLLHELLAPLQLLGAALLLGGAIVGECLGQKGQRKRNESTLRANRRIKKPIPTKQGKRETVQF